MEHIASTNAGFAFKLLKSRHQVLRLVHVPTQAIRRRSAGQYRTTIGAGAGVGTNVGMRKFTPARTTLIDGVWVSW